VVSNSLTLRFYKPGKRNWISTLAPIIMIALFTGLFFEFARFSSTMANAETQMDKTAISSAAVKDINVGLAEGSIKINFTNGDPKAFVTLNMDRIKDLKLFEGAKTLEDNSMLIGYDEAMMMKKENLFGKPGDALNAFFGVETMKIVGVLAPTGTILDKMHIVNGNTYKALKSSASIETAKSEDGTTKFFYIIKGNVPERLKDSMQDTSFNPVVIGGKTFQPVYIGNAEAATMVNEKIFEKEGDRIENFFGINAIISGILPKTDTILDNFHYISVNAVDGK